MAFLVKASKLTWYAGIAGVVLSGALNAIFLIESTHMVTIQVPTHTLQPYETIQASDVTTKRVSAKSLNADTLKGNLVGKVTSMTIPEGDPIQSFEIAQQGSMAQVIQSLYQKYPNYAFADIQVQDNALSQTVQPGQHATFIANNIPYPDVWVLSVSNPSEQTSNIGSQVGQAVSNFVTAAPSTSTSSSGGTLTFLIGAPWSTVQTLMNSTPQVVMGNSGTTQYTLGSPPVNGVTPPTTSGGTSTAANQGGKVGVAHAK